MTRRILLALFATIFSVASYAQTIDFTYQGWSGQSGNNKLSLYIAKDGFKLGSAFNDENYPVWYVENQEINIVSGVVNYRLTGISLDSLEKYRGELYLYVSINGTPHDTIIMDPAPYAGSAVQANRANIARLANQADTARYADVATVSRLADSAVESNHAVWADTAMYSLNSARSDSAIHAIESNRAIRSDVSLYASSSAHAVWSDSAEYAVNAAHASMSDNATNADRASVADSAVASARAVNATNADHAIHADSADVSRNAHFVYANGVNLAAISASGATVGATLVTDGTSLQWRGSTNIEGRVQLTLVPLNTIDADVRTIIYRVAQDITTPLPAASQGRIITIVNSSTANTVSIQAGVWNIWGGDVYIGPRNSATLLYHNGQWVVIAQ